MKKEDGVESGGFVLPHVTVTSHDLRVWGRHKRTKEAQVSGVENRHAQFGHLGALIEPIFKGPCPSRR